MLRLTKDKKRRRDAIEVLFAVACGGLLIAALLFF